MAEYDRSRETGENDMTSPALCAACRLPLYPDDEEELCRDCLGADLRDSFEQRAQDLIGAQKMQLRQLETVLEKRQAEQDTKRDFLKLIAHDIGKSVADYIEYMFPEAVKAAPSTFLLSLTNTIHNEIMALADFKGGRDEMLQRIDERRKHWRELKRRMRVIRREERK